MDHFPTEIAETIGVHKSTISRESTRNRGRRGYRPKQARHPLLDVRLAEFCLGLSCQVFWFIYFCTPLKFTSIFLRVWIFTWVFYWVRVHLSHKRKQAPAEFQGLVLFLLSRAFYGVQLTWKPTGPNHWWLGLSI